TDLGLIDVAIELDVPGAKPPIVRQLESEVAARLARLAPTDIAARAGSASWSWRMASAEQARKGGEIVVPIVIAGQRKQEPALPIASSGLAFVCVGKWGAQLGVVVLLRRGWVDLVAAEHQHAALQQRFRSRLALRTLRWAQLGSCEQASDRVGGSPAVTGVGAEIEPEIAVCGVMCRRRKVEVGVEIASVEWIERGNELAPIEHLSEHSGLGHPDADRHKPDGIVPAGHCGT